MFQTHQYYPVLRYFHYRDTSYALPRLLLVTLDAVALLPAALVGDDRLAMSDGAAVALASGAARDLLHELVPRATSTTHHTPDDDRRAANESGWRYRFETAVEQFRAAGLDVRADRDALEKYLARRRTWDADLRALAEDMLYEWDETEKCPVVS